MAFDPGLAERIRETLLGMANINEKQMFGGLAFIHQGHMFIGIAGDVLMARVGPANYPFALNTRYVREMDFTGKPMKGYVFVDPPAFESDHDLATWVKICLDFTSTLPPKP